MSYALSVIKSIQRGTTTTATITAVVLGKSHCSLLGTRTEETDLNKAMATVYLTNTTTVTCQLASTPGSGNGRTNFEVVEYF